MTRSTAGTRVVLDTQVWLDWLVFHDPDLVALREAHAAGRVDVVIDDACEAELARVLAYDLGRFSLGIEEQARRLERCKRVATRVISRGSENLPACRDPDDQKFLELAAAARASFLLTKDQALLELSGKIRQFRIVRPRDWNCSRLWNAR